MITTRGISRKLIIKKAHTRERRKERKRNKSERTIDKREKKIRFYLDQILEKKRIEKIISKRAKKKENDEEERRGCKLKTSNL